MESSFLWLDHRQKDAERVREALAALGDHGMVDPLGFGIIRDAFSEMLFPGMSTIQTRARYFLMVPWVFQSLVDEGVDPRRASGRARQLELDLIQSLLRGSADRDGIIGQRSWPNTKQLPSFIYWGGLGRWRIRRFEGTRYEYFQSLGQQRRRDDEDEPALWHLSLPRPPEDLFEATSLALSTEEGDFLRDRILAAAGDSFLAVLARDASLEERADTPWEHPRASSAPPEVRLQLGHAKLFAIATWGAGLIYNERLSRLLRADGYEGLEDDYQARLREWLDLMEAHHHEFGTWNREEFWHLVRRESPGLPHGLVSFVGWWLDQALGDPATTSDDDVVFHRLREREASIKGARAKLANQGARERSASAQGDRLMLYRWPQVRRIVADIQQGLTADA